VPSGIERGDHPAARSNIVFCAESLPGSGELLGLHALRKG
jgi:hypothetical protein